MRTSSAARGAWAEDIACSHLMARGLRLMARNYRCRHGEIDLVMRDGVTIAFVEVRFRSRADFGSGAESVDARKRARLVSTAEHYLQRHASLQVECRFDIVSILQTGNTYRLDWIQNAFGA